MREFKQYLLSLMILSGILSAFVFLRYADGYPFPVGPQFNPQIRHIYEITIEKEQPQIVVIGDSVAASNIDPDLMTIQLKEPVMMITEFGGGSALFYLIIKNNIATAEYKPDVLVLMFRDTVLTSPGFRVRGSYFAVLDEYARRDDDLALKLAVLDQMSPLEKLAERYFPPYWARWDLRSILVFKTINSPLWFLFGCDATCYESAMEERFDDEALEVDELTETMNSAEDFLYTDANLDFEKQVERSFLPEIVRICKENNIQLVLLRTKIQRFSRENPEPAALREYIEDLNAYAEENGVVLVDFAHDERLQPALFEDSHHLNEVGKRLFSEMLAEEIESEATR